MSASRAVRLPGCVLSDVAEELRLSSGHVGVVCVCRCNRPRGFAKGGNALACGQESCRRMENGVSDAESTFLGEATVPERSLHMRGEEVAVWEHRAGMRQKWRRTRVVAGVEVVELGHESLGAVQLFLEFAEAEIWRDRKRRPEMRSICRVEPFTISEPRADGCRCSSG